MTRIKDIHERELHRRMNASVREKAEALLPRFGHTRSLNRRTFLLGSTAAGLGWTRISSAQGTATPFTTPDAPPVANISFSKNPFQLGIASGEPLPDGVVLWTRLVPEPFEPDGGMPAASVEVRWEVASDERMTDIVQQGTTLADFGWAHSVHLEVSGLEPGRWYWYRFIAGGMESPVGRTRTAPAVGSSPESFTFAFASCQRWEDGLFTAYRDLAQQDVDLVVHLGDYIYEYLVHQNESVRDFDVPFTALNELRDLDDYRMRYALYKLDPDLQEAHRVAPWIVTWDDHEVNNNYFGKVVRDSPFAEPLLKRREVAYKAFYEHQPLRKEQRPEGPDLQLYRAVEFGNLVRFNVLDTRQYRSVQVRDCSMLEREELDGFCEAALDPTRTMLGDHQKQWLLDGFGQTVARWNVLAQQVPMARIDYDASSRVQSFGGEEMDKWDGYVAEREEVLDAMADAAAARSFNPIVITGDVHVNQVWDLKRDWDAEDSETVFGTEFVGTSISSGGDVPLKEDGGFTTECGNWLGNPHNHLFDNHRGYVLCAITADQMLTTYRVMSSVEDPKAPASTLTSFVVEHGRPGAQADQMCVPGVSL